MHRADLFNQLFAFSLISHTLQPHRRFIRRLIRCSWQCQQLTLGSWIDFGTHLGYFDICRPLDTHHTPTKTQTGDCISTNKVHEATITDLQMSADRTYFITASKDKSAKIIESESLEVLKTYTTDTPLNSAAIMPKVQEFVVVGGGQEAMDVTRTSSRQGKFECRFWHKILEEEVGRVRGHFGPINTIAIHPDGRSFASGGEDGYVRVHHFDDDFFSFKFQI